jgi:hypothetical protein
MPRTIRFSSEITVEDEPVEVDVEAQYTSGSQATMTSYGGDPPEPGEVDISSVRGPDGKVYCFGDLPQTDQEKIVEDALESGLDYDAG